MSERRPWICAVCEEPGDACACGVDIHPERCGGRWTLRGHRIWARSVMQLGEPRFEEFYPQVRSELLLRVRRWIAAGGAEILIAEHLLEAADESEDLTQLARLCRIYRRDEGAYHAIVREAATQAWRRMVEGAADIDP